jgi:hypothetical protein
MNWDHRDNAALAKIIGDYSESQQGEGGYNKDNNCVPTTECVIAQEYGAPDINPQTITDHTYGTTFHGGEDYGATIATLRTLWPECPSVSMPAYGDVLAQCDIAGSQRQAVACSFHCNAAAQILTYSTGILHVSQVVAHVDTTWFVLNVENDGLITLSDADFRAATTSPAGALLIFNAPLPGGTMNAAKEESLDQETAWKSHHNILGRTPNADEFAWALGVARTSHTDLLWAIVNGDEFKKTGGLVGLVLAQGAQIAQLTAQVATIIGQHGIDAVVSAGEDAQNAHIAAVQAAMAAISQAAAGAGTK